MTDVAYIALGSNLGNRELALEEHVRPSRRSATPDSSPRREVEETDALGPVPQGRFLNQMVAVETASCAASTLLAALHRIERAAGRVRVVRWGPRHSTSTSCMIEGKEFQDEALDDSAPRASQSGFLAARAGELRGMAEWLTCRRPRSGSHDSRHRAR